MDIDSSLHNTVVLGAAGKMGSGISLLLLQQIAFIDDATLTLLDTNRQGFVSLKKYLRDQLKKFAERNINLLRAKYTLRLDLIDNEEIIAEFIEQALNKVQSVVSLEECQGATLLFEAIIEDIELKAEVFRKAAIYAAPEAYYFTNTSSIPIAILQERSRLQGRLIGFHFYNPPLVQQLLEIIIPEEIQPSLKEIALSLSERLKKIVVFSKDVAGFIGNGHLIREIGYACQMVKRLESTMGISEAIFCIDFMTREFLLRPMGIFQLVDYVGVDVCQHIQEIMTTYLQSGPFGDPLIDAMVGAGVHGGQYADGTQKDGILTYAQGVPMGVYNTETKGYLTASAEKLGPLPPGHLSWKELKNDKQKKDKIANYFSSLWKEDTLGAELSKDFLKNSRAFAHILVDSGVAQSLKDVDTVLEKGFYHIYDIETPFATHEGSK